MRDPADTNRMLAGQDADDEGLYLRIGLPLPLSVSSAIMNAVGEMWPGTVICSPNADSRSPRQEMVFHIPQTDRADVVPFDPVEADGALTAWIGAMQPEGVVLHWPEDMALWLAGHLVLPAFEEYPDAVNYIVMPIHHGPVGDRVTTTVTVHTTRGKTAHELREEAEGKVARLEAELVERGAGVCVRCGMALNRLDKDRWMAIATGEPTCRKGDEETWRLEPHEPRES